MMKAEEDLVRQQWNNETSISHNRKDQVRKSIGVNRYKEHQVHYLQVPQVNQNHTFPFSLHSVALNYLCSTWIEV